MILTDLRHKIKSSVSLLDRRDFYTALLIVMTATAAYMLGLLSAGDVGAPPVTVRSSAAVSEALQAAPTAQKTVQSAKPAATTGAYVASKSGTKYHLPTCSGARTIAAANKIWFATKADAEAAGYSPAANCPGI